MIKKTLVLMVPLLCCAGCAGRLHTDDRDRTISAELPIKRVVLYQNGVGYFEREGELDGDVLTLHCRPHQINDLLKSLTVIDRGTGRPVSVSLPLEKTGAKVLSELPKQVRGASGLLDVLRVFRGARVTVRGRDGTVSGRVIGVEQGLLDKTKEGPITGWRLTLKSDKGGLEVYPVNAIKRLTLMDRALEVGLDKSLDVSLDEGTWKPVSLSVRLAGSDKHDLLVSYIVEMPNWKPAYRLVIQPERPPLLQGWAVVDNVSGESWSDAKLSLVAGTPMSFVYDLHSPRFTRRVDLTPRGTHTALAPTREKAGYLASGNTEKTKSEDKSAKDRLQRYFSRSRRARRAPSASAAPTPKPAPAPPPRIPRPTARSGESVSSLNVMLEKQIKTRVEGKRVGSLFRYDLKDPVTVPDNSSTLVNIVNTRVKGGEVVLFRPELTRSYSAAHPYRAVRMGNSTGFTLEKGPVTIYSQGTFVGEGFVERMEKDATIFLTYAIDGRVSMSRSTGWGREVVRLLKISGGRIRSEVLDIDRRKYTLESRHDKPITAYIKSIGRSGYKLRKAPAETVKTAAASYVPVTIPAGGKAKIDIEWVRPTRSWLGVDTSLATNVLKLFISSGKVPEAIRPTLDKILKAKARLDQINVETSRIKKLKRELAEDQARVRDNLNLLRKVKGNPALRQRLTRNLAKLEAKLTKLTGSYVKLDEERAKLRGTIRVLIGEISLDATKS